MRNVSSNACMSGQPAAEVADRLMEVLAPWSFADTERRKPLSSASPYSSLHALRNSHASFEPVGKFIANS